MAEITADISWLAVIVGAVLSMMLGFLMFDPKRATGRIWAEGTGMLLDPPESFPVLPMAMNTLGLLTMSWFVGVTAKSDALLTVILATLAFALLNGANSMFAGNSKGAAAVQMGYWLLSLLLMILSQGVLG